MHTTLGPANKNKLLLYLRSTTRKMITILRHIQMVLVATLAIGAFVAPTASAQNDGDYRIIRDVNGSGGQAMQGGAFGLHGTVSQTTIGRVSTELRRQGVGFWYWAREFDAFACIRLGNGEANPGERVMIPLLIEDMQRFPVQAPTGFRVRIRFNRSLLQPDSEELPGCTFEGNECVLEITGAVTPESIQSGVLAEMFFLAKLGDSESTPLIIESFEWTGVGEGQIETVTKDGLFTLLGICREGGEIRLVHSAGPASRIRVFPNPASDRVSVEFTSKEEGRASLVLIDQFGREVATLAEQGVEAAQLYRVDVDLMNISSGAYFVILRTPGEIKTMKLVIEQ